MFPSLVSSFCVYHIVFIDAKIDSYGSETIDMCQNSYKIICISILLLLSRFSRVRLCDPIDVSLPGYPVPGILQARTLEWVAISSTCVILL